VPISAEEPTPQDGDVVVDFLMGDDRSTTSAAVASMPTLLLVSVAGIVGAFVMTF
jgi:hypothetical protein